MRVGWLQAKGSVGALLSTISLVASGAALSGCGMTKNLDEMHDSTAQMAVTTAQMNEKMDQLAQMNQRMTAMNDSMDKLLQSMSHMSEGMDAMQGTMTSMVSLMGQMTDMNKAMQDMKSQMSTMIGTLDSMNSQMAVMPQMKDSLTQINGVIGQLNTMMASLDKKMDELPKMSKTMSGMSGQIGAMKTELVNMHKDLGVLNSMNKALGTMSSGMGTMITDMGTMNQKMTHVDSTMTDTAVTAVHGVGESVRESALNSMIKADTLALKFTFAAPFLFAYDYQLVFKGTNAPNQADEDKFRVDAVTDFMLRISGMMDTDKTIDLTAQGGNMQNLFAFAAALERIDANTLVHVRNLEQEAKTDPSKVRAYPYFSMWGMIEYALDRKSKIEHGEAKDDPALAWETIVLQKEDVAVYLAQLRENIAAAVVLQNFSDKLPVNPKGLWAALGQGLTVLEYANFDWTAATDRLNLEQLGDNSNMMGLAIEAKQFLDNNGYPRRMDDHLQGALRHCQIDSDVADPDRKAALEKIKGQIADYLK